MKLRRLGSILIMVALLAGVCAVAQARPYENVVANGGFEQGLEGWSTELYRSNAVIGTALARAGTDDECAFVRLEGKTPAEGYARIYTKEFSYLYGGGVEDYYCRAVNRRVASSDASKVTSSIVLRCFDSSGKGLKVISVWSGRGDGHWRRFGRTVRAAEFPEATSKVLVELHTRGTMGGNKRSITDFWNDVWFGQDRAAPVITSLSSQQDEGGHLVTIDFLHNYGAPRVTIGGADAKVDRDSYPLQDQMIVRIPLVEPGATTLCLTTDYGSTSSAFTVLPSQLPRIDTITPTSGQGGITVTLRGEHFDGASSLKKIHWYSTSTPHFACDWTLDPETWSDTEITFRTLDGIPPGLNGVTAWGDGTMTVYNDHGHSNSVEFNSYQ